MSHRSPAQRDAGFSLVEMLVVLAVVGLAASTVILAVPGRSMSLAREADLFAHQLLEARDLALIRNRPVMVEIDAAGYAVRLQEAGGWLKPVEAALWTDDASVSAEGGPLPVSVVFDPMGMAEPAVITLRRRGGAETVAVDAVGDVRRLGETDAR
jgi:general secretion pathway protein H